MPRGRSSFTKRQKEQSRQQKQRDKAERRVQRKQDKPEGESLHEMDELRQAAEAQAAMPGCAEYLSVLGGALYRAGRSEDSLRTIAQAAQAHPEHRVVEIAEVQVRELQIKRRGLTPWHA